MGPLQLLLPAAMTQSGTQPSHVQKKFRRGQLDIIGFGMLNICIYM